MYKSRYYIHSLLLSWITICALFSLTCIAVNESSCSIAYLESKSLAIVRLRLLANFPSCKCNIRYSFPCHHTVNPVHAFQISTQRYLTSIYHVNNTTIQLQTQMAKLKKQILFIAFRGGCISRQVCWQPRSWMFRHISFLANDRNLLDSLKLLNHTNRQNMHHQQQS